MAGRGDRQELREPLNGAEGERLPVGELARLFADSEQREHEGDYEQPERCYVDDCTAPIAVKVLENRIVSDRCRSGQFAVRTAHAVIPSCGKLRSCRRNRCTWWRARTSSCRRFPDARSRPARTPKPSTTPPGGRLDRAGFVLRRRVENGKGIWRLTVTSDGESALEVEALGRAQAPPAGSRS